MLISSLIYLLAAVIAVPIAKRLGLGSVLGYLLAGVAIGPSVLHLVGEQSDVMHFAEFGVVIMLFLIGLELRPERLWQMRKPILGLGGLQVILTIALITGLLCVLTPLHLKTCLAISMTVTLSSTAIVLQSLTERGLIKTNAGKNAFSVLLFQDIAVIPILAILPLLSILPDDAAPLNHSSNLISDLAGWLQFAIAAAAIGLIIIGGKFLSAPIFRMIAETRMNEVFTAFALLIVVAIAALMQAIGLSAALGSFLAGVVLAESEFRHEIEINIEPFKGLLLGLFFITVGASIDFNLIANHPGMIAAAVAGLILIKALVLGILAWLFGLEKRQGLLFTLALAQGGEFAFVLVSAGTQFQAFDATTGSLITVVVALSMLLSPLLLIAYEAIASRPSALPSKLANQTIEATEEVIIAGYGRFGQVVGRLLSAQGFKLTILDHSPSQIELVRRFGNKVFYGDASRRDLLEAAGAADAKMLVVAVDEPNKTLEIIQTAKKYFPQLKIVARAIDRRHAYALEREKVDAYRRETFDSALSLGVDALKVLGRDLESAENAGRLFADHDMETLSQLAKVWGDDKSYGIAVKQRLADLNQVLQTDMDQRNEAAREANQKTE